MKRVPEILGRFTITNYEGIRLYEKRAGRNEVIWLGRKEGVK